jgi:hypothetical protein
MLGPGRTHLPLSEAVRWCAETREVMRGVDGQLPAHWKYGWLPMTRGHLTVFDCSGALDAPVPVRYYRFDEPDAGAAGVPSIGTLVGLYIEAFDCGAWSYHSHLQTWQLDSTRLDSASRREHLI